MPAKKVSWICFFFLCLLCFEWRWAFYFRKRDEKGMVNISIPFLVLEHKKLVSHNLLIYIKALSVCDRLISYMLLARASCYSYFNPFLFNLFFSILSSYKHRKQHTVLHTLLIYIKALSLSVTGWFPIYFLLELADILLSIHSCLFNLSFSIPYIRIENSTRFLKQIVTWNIVLFHEFVPSVSTQWVWLLFLLKI